MQITNKKLIKNFRDILAASINAKGLLSSEIEKVDAKYAELAKKEKAELLRQDKALDAQIEMCNSFLKGADTSSPVEDIAPSSDDNTTDSTQKDKVVDTLFPENNAVDSPSETDDDPVDTVESNPEEEWEETPEWEGNDWSKTKDIQDVSENASAEVNEEEEEAEDDADASGEDEWPEIPEEW